MRAPAAILALTFAAAFAMPALAQTTTSPATTTKPAATTPAPATPVPATTPPATTAPAKPAAAATSPAKPGAPPSAAETALHQRQAACGAEWRAAKAAGKIPAGQTWPKYWSACNTRLKAQGK